MKIVTIAIAASALMIAACGDDVEQVLEVEHSQEVQGVLHEISQERAVESLRNFLRASDSNGLKSLSSERELTIDNVLSVKKSQADGNKALAAMDGEGNLLYVANFSNNNGYAILAADDRIGCDVLAVIDEGSMSEEGIQLALAKSSSERRVYDGYPLTGDGFYTVPEYPGEVFMNPNTVSLYDEKEKDTYVGNFSLDDEESYVYGGLKAYQRAPTLDEIERMGLGECAGYASNQVQNSKYSQRTIDISPECKNNIIDWDPLYSWHQESPFNSNHPRRRKGIIFGKRRQVKCGCFPLAIAKVMTKLLYPTKYYVNGQEINWDMLNANLIQNIGEKAKFPTEAQNRMVASLLYSVSESCHSKYFYQGTFTFPNKAESFLRSIGFRDADSYDYDYGRIKEMIDRQCPVIIYAVHNLAIWDSHAWNIDGYKEQKQKVEKVRNSDGVVVEVTETVNRYVHCDYGWGKKANGFYYSGIFEKGKAYSLDDKDAVDRFKFNAHKKIIMYEK